MGQSAEHGQGLGEWFEVRLRYIAALKMSGADDRTVPLISELRERAAAANDFLTLRRLRLLQEANPLSPVPPRPHSSRGDSLPRRRQRRLMHIRRMLQTPADVSLPQQGPMRETIDRLTESLRVALTETGNSAAQPDMTLILRDILAIAPGKLAHPVNAGRLLHMAPYVIYNVPDRVMEASLELG